MAVEQLVSQYRPMLLGHALRHTSGDRAWAEDIVQETFIRAWRHRDVMSDEHGSVRAWLARVVHNLAVDGHRRHRAYPVGVAEPDLHGSPVEDETDRVEARLVIRDALRLLPDHQREVVEALYLRGETVSEVAVALGIPSGTVKSRAHYALRRLRDAVTAQGG